MSRRILWTESFTVTLRQLGSSDLDAVHALISRMDVVRDMLFPLCTREDSERFVADSIVPPAHSAWRSIVRAILADGDLVGLCGISILRGAEEGEIWYLVRPECQGRGIATEAARQSVRLGFEEFGLHRLWATCVPENSGSARVLEKIGMRREGLQLRNLRIHGEWKSSFLYAILEDEWHGCAISVATSI